MEKKLKVGNDRKIKFDKQLRYDRQKNYNIFDYDLIPYKDKMVYKNFNFSIFIDDYCNADCKFCVAQLRYEHKKLIYKKEKLDYDAYMIQLERVLKEIKLLNPSVSITGGEPTMSPKILDVIKLVNKYDFRKRTITTNGSHLLDNIEGKTLIEHLIENKYQHLNISRVTEDEELNKKIMRYNSEEGYCSNEMIKEILRVTKDTNLHHRLSCLLIKDVIDDVEKIKRYIDFYQNIGADNFIFRQMMNYSEDAINKEKIDYCNENHVELNKIWEEMEKYPVFQPYLNLLGYYYYVEIYKYKNAIVASESADLNQQYNEFDKHPNTIYEMVYHPNGNLCASWVDKDKILMRYNDDKETSNYQS